MEEKAMETNQNYTVYHLHSDLSNGITNVDSITKYHEYIDLAASLGMTAMGFSEHGSIYEWYHKKEAIEKAGMKYIHAVEVYVTEYLTIVDKETEEEKRLKDNYHCVLIAKNYQGFRELNRLVSLSFNRANAKTIDGELHFYNRPRITLDELCNTSENIIITTACLAGILASGTKTAQEKFLKFLVDNKERCFLEIQHHNDDMQKHYNMYLDNISKKYGIPLIAGTDTHSLNAEHAEARLVLQKGKGVHFDGENNLDMTFKTYDELIIAYKNQGILAKESYMSAINNTNVMANMIEPFELDHNTKYPHLYDDPVKAYIDKIKEGCKKRAKYISKRYDKKVLLDKIQEELNTYKKTKSIDFMLLQTYIREWEKENDIACGYGRGSVSGSEIAYILGITEMDSMKFNLNFFRFMNPSRITNADIDSDYSSKDREKIKYFLLHDHMNLPQIQSSEIITFNTIALKGAIKDIGRSLGMPLDLTQAISDAVYLDENKKFTVDESYKKQYPELFKYAELVSGTIVSVGTHPSGVLVSDLNLSEEIGLCTISSSNYPVSMLNMKELDALMYVKLDILGLDNIGVINDCCKLAGIERLTPDNVDLTDEKVWKSIRDDTTMIFQWESDGARAYLKQFMSDETVAIAKKANKDFSYIKWFSFGNGLIRPGCASFRYDVADGDITITGFKELDEFLSMTFGRVTMQEDIMQFLVKFCGYSDAESDTVRRGIAKKYGTEKFIDEIHNRFIEYSHSKYGIDEIKLEEIFPPIKQGIIDATRYAFSWNHSDAYSCIGYICGYLRYYYPLEFITAALNIFHVNAEKSKNIIEYANKIGIEIDNIKFGKSKAEYVMDKETNSIYKGIGSIKYCNAQIADELYELSQNNNYSNFVELLSDIHKKTSINSRQLTILIGLNFFLDFGNNQYLMNISNVYDKFSSVKQIKKDKMEELGLTEYLMKKYADQETAKMYKGIDNIGLVEELTSKLENKCLSVIDQVKFEIEYLEYCVYINPRVNEQYFIVTEYRHFKEVRKPYVKLHNIKTGEDINTRIKSVKIYEKNPFGLYSILKVKEFSMQNKTKNVNGAWIKTDELEPILEQYEVIK